MNQHKKVHSDNFLAHFGEDGPKSSVTSQNQSLQIILQNVIQMVCLNVQKEEAKMMNLSFRRHFFSSTTT
jgi:hypothetical protein